MEKIEQKCIQQKNPNEIMCLWTVFLKIAILLHEHRNNKKHHRIYKEWSF